MLDEEVGLVSATDLSGNTMTVSPDGISTSNGDDLVIVRDLAGRVASVEGPSGETVTYGYDAAGDLESVTDSIGESITYTYTDHLGLLHPGLAGRSYRGATAPRSI